jgi:hypothetical protein
VTRMNPSRPSSIRTRPCLSRRLPDGHDFPHADDVMVGELRALDHQPPLDASGETAGTAVVPEALAPVARRAC